MIRQLRIPLCYGGALSGDLVRDRPWSLCSAYHNIRHFRHTSCSEFRIPYGKPLTKIMLQQACRAYIHLFMHIQASQAPYNSICLSIHTKCTYASLVKLFGCKVFIHLVMFFSPLVLSTNTARKFGEKREKFNEFSITLIRSSTKQHTHNKTTSCRDRETDRRTDRGTNIQTIAYAALCTILSYHSEHSIHFANDG